MAQQNPSCLLHLSFPLSHDACYFAFEGFDRLHVNELSIENHQESQPFGSA